MTVRPPRLGKPADRDPLAAALEQEIFNEKASTLSRLTKNLEAALARLAETGGEDRDERQHLERLAAAGEALWNVTIQRELCGLRQHKAFYDFLGVPKAVRLNMGPAGLVLKSIGNRQSKEQ
ncbi:MAG: hypothetical protein Tsb0019_22390 [Roseibium sp.]